MNINAAGYLALQRPAHVSWHGWTVVDDVVLTQAFVSPDLFVAGGPTQQVVRGFVTPAGEDADGSRQAVIVFPENTHLTNFAVADGTPLEVQLTELTRGPQGPQRMPGELPPTSGYTYAFEASIPAALAAGVHDVAFDRDVAVYIDNFTHYPVGETVPLGFYDRNKGAWMAEKSGRIIRVLSIAGGTATLDVTGDGIADTGTTLSDLGITTSELQTLAAQYATGTELWRVTMRHFSSWDCNWVFFPPAGAAPPPGPGDGNKDDGASCELPGSIIGCESRTLGEEIPIVGTPFKLRYQSNRTPGYHSRLRLQLTDGTPLPPSFLRARIEIEIAGRRLRFDKPAPLPLNDSFAWTWDGRDGWGRDVGTGKFDVRVRIGFEYAGTSTGSTQSFAEPPGTAMTGDRVARTLTLWREMTTSVERMAAAPLGFGGWTLNVHHVADFEGSILHSGDGHSRRMNDQVGNVVRSVAGNGNPYGADNEGGLATQASVGTVVGIAHAPDGTLYFAERDYFNGGRGRIRRVRTDGTISTVAGLAPTVAKVDGAPALHAVIAPTSMTLSPDGSIYFAESNNHQVWRIAPGTNPTIHHVAGDGFYDGSYDPSCPKCRDGGDARLASLEFPADVAVASDGTVFISDSGPSHGRIRRIGPEGIITTYVRSLTPGRLSLRPDGVLFVLDGSYGGFSNGNVTRVEPDGSTQRLLKDANVPGIYSGYITDLASMCRTHSRFPSSSWLCPMNLSGWHVTTRL